MSYLPKFAGLVCSSDFYWFQQFLPQLSHHLLNYGILLLISNEASFLWNNNCSFYECQNEAQFWPQKMFKCNLKNFFSHFFNACLGVGWKDLFLPELFFAALEKIWHIHCREILNLGLSINGYCLAHKLVRFDKNEYFLPFNVHALLNKYWKGLSLAIR